jgi:co-chaperonin GroES (HSP10)
VIRPLGNRVLVRVEPEPPRSGIIHYDAKSRMQRGTILALGPKARRSGLEVGDVVVFGQANFISSQAKAVSEKMKDDSDNRERGILKDTDLLFVLEPGYNPTLS